MSEDSDLTPDAPPLEHADSDGAVVTPKRGAGDGRGFSVWAPAAARAVTLHLGDAQHPLTPAGQGWWSTEVTAEPGDRYGYQLDDGPVMPSPRATRLPDGPHGLSQVFDPDAFAWTDDDWPGVPLQGAVLYEMHVGTFTAEGTFDAAIHHLDHLVDLGVDVVEIMPVASFPGRFGWGYDGVATWAVHEPYGGPEGLQRFVDACHSRGLGVCLDVVYNHLGPDGAYLFNYGPYFTDRHHTPWGMALNLDGPNSDPVRDYIVGNVVHWFTDYHLDGLRLDAVHELHDTRAIHILESISTRVHELEEELGRHVWAVAETDRNDPRTVIPVEQGGLGMDGQWADDIHHGLHVALTGERQGYYEDFGKPGALATILASPFYHADTWSSFRGRRHGKPLPAGVDGWRFVAFLQNHDQVGNRRTGDRQAATLSPRRLRCGATLLLTSPFTPMLFMGEEWGASTPWQYFTAHTDEKLAEAVRAGRRAEFGRHGWGPEDVPDPQDPATRDRSVLDWDEVTQGEHRRTLKWYRALIALRRARADLRDPDLAQVVVRHDEASGLVVVERGRHRVAVNLGTTPVDADLGLESTRGLVVLLAADRTTTLSEEGHVTLLADGAVVVGPSTVD